MKAAICAIIKEEERDVLEWMLFHVAIGFDAIILYENGSEDRTYEVAKRAGYLFDLRLIKWPEKFSQLAVYDHAYKNYGREFDWLCVIDSDEFVVPVRDRNIKRFLGTMDRHAAIAANWALYGSSGHIEIPSGLVVENFLSRAALDFGGNRHVKSFVRPEAIQSVHNPHVFRLDARFSYVDVLGYPCTWVKNGKFEQCVGQDVCRINHYFTKSREHYAIKLARGNANGGVRPDMFRQNDRNDVYDPIIPREFSGEVSWVKERIGGLG
jgi:glycosyltransferase involved in cell wall biosynthesis